MNKLAVFTTFLLTLSANSFLFGQAINREENIKEEKTTIEQKLEKDRIVRGIRDILSLLKKRSYSPNENFYYIGRPRSIENIIGSESRLSLIQDTYTTAMQNRDIPGITDQTITDLKIYLIFELIANAKNNDAIKLWNELDKTVYTDEWMQNALLVWTARSANPSVRASAIDTYILKNPQSLIGYRAKIFRLLNGNLPENAEEPAKTDMRTRRSSKNASHPQKIRGKENKRKARQIVKHVLTSFPFVDVNSKKSSQYSILHYDQLAPLFRLFCLLSGPDDRQDIVRTFETLQKNPFFEKAKDSKYTRGSATSEEMVRSFEYYDLRIKAKEKKPSNYYDVDAQIFSFPFRYEL